MSNLQRNKSPWFIENFEKTTAFSKAFDFLNCRILSSGKIVTMQEKIVRVVVFAIKGGLAKPRQLTYLINDILENRLNIKISPIAPFIEFENLNESEEGNEGFLRWLIDTESLAAIHSLNVDQKKRRLRPLDEKSLFALLKKHFVTIPEFKHISSLKMLCGAGATFLAEHPLTNLPAYLVSFATGQTMTTSVSSNCWAGLWHTSSKPVKKAENLVVETLIPPQITPNIQCPKTSDKTFLSRLRLAIKEKNENGILIPNATTIAQLQALRSSITSLRQTILLEFIHQGIKEQGWKVSSANTYLGHIGTNWLSFTRDIELATLDENGTTDLFDKMLHIADGNVSQADKVSVLKQFFVFAAEVFDLELPTLDHVTVRKVNNVRNYVISEANFMRFINDISAVEYHQTLAGQGLILAAILMARCGLRPGEVIKLRLKDVEPSPQYYLFTRQNKFGTNKTYSALRKIPLFLLLTPNEFTLFESYLKRRLIDANNQLSLLLFSSNANANLPYSLSDFYQKFSERLSRICGENVHTYHLRHKGISTLHVVLTSDESTFINPYNESQITRIRRFFSVESGRDALYELAAFAGHLSPATTFKSYLHFTDVILYEQLTENEQCRPRRYWENLSALSKHIFTRRCANETPNHKEVESLLIESLCGKQAVHLIAKAANDEVQSFRPPKRKVTYVECLTALRLLDAGATISQVADKLDIEDEIIDCWCQKSDLAASIKTSKRMPRLFPAKRNEDKRSFIPIEPPSNAEQKRAEQIIEVARQLFKDQPDELIWFIRRVVTTAMNSHSYLPFDDLTEFQRFLNFALKFTGIKEWQVELDLPENERSSALTNWKKIHDELTILVSNKRVLAKKFTKGRARLYFLHPRRPATTVDSKSRRYSSNVIKFVCHILSIMIPDVLATKQTKKSA